MIQVCARPTDAPVVKGEALYSLEFKLGSGRYEPLMKVRAKNGPLAERKLMTVFRHELTGKELDFRLEDFEEIETAGTTADGLQAGSPDTNE